MFEAAVAGTKYKSEYAVEGTGSEEFSLTTWAEDYDENSCPLRPLESYPRGALAIVSAWSYQDMADGEDFVALYYHDHEFIYSDFFAWDEGSNNQCYVLSLNYGGSAMPDGDYRIEIYAGKGYPLIASADTAIGPVKSGDVKLTGGIYDGLTYDGIPDASLTVLNPGVDPDAWLDAPTESDIFTAAKTDKSGNYTVADKMERQVDYPIVVVAEGYYSYTFTWRIGLADEGTLYITIQPR
jgi:hypothetical protein